MVSNGQKAVCVLLWVAVDVGVTTLLCPLQLYDFWRTFAVRLAHYGVTTSMSDVWALSVVRAALLVGALFGCLRNTASGAHRVRRAHTVITVLAVVMWDFPVVKLLLWSEREIPAGHLFWALLAWSLVTPVLFVVCWYVLGTLQATRGLSVNSEERRSLLEDTTADGDTPAPQKYATLGRLLSYSRPDWHLLLLAFCFLLMASSAQIFTPWYTGQVIEGIAIDKDHSRFTRAIIFLALFSLGSSIAAGLRGGCFSICIARLSMRIRNKLFSSIVSQEIGFFDVTQTGELTSRLTADTTIMADALGLNTNVFLRSIITSVGICVFMFKLSWQLSLVTLLGFPVLVCVSKVYGGYYEGLAEEIQGLQAKANRVAEEVASSMRTVRSFAAENDERCRYQHHLSATYRVQKKEAAAYAGYVWSNQLLELALVVCTLYYGGRLVIAGHLTGGNLVSFILYQMEFGAQLESIGDVYTGLMQAKGASEKVFEFISRRPRIPASGSRVVSRLEGKLELRDVTFSYPSRPDVPVLKNVSLTVQPGEVVALVGPSGSGKSSCVGLLQRYYEADQGQVLVDDTPIQEYDHHCLHQQVALVGQEPVLYARSIEENIAYGLEVTDPARVQRAARLANAHDFVSQLRDQYQTQAGEKGVQLSGGQKQRVAIARAVIREPAVLLLDEATSALDAESEHLVQEALYQNLSGRTVVIVAHRLSTVERASRIIVLSGGEVVETGTHAELVTAGGLYARLVHRQLVGGDLAPPAPTPAVHRGAAASLPRSAGYGAIRTSTSTGSASYDDRRGFSKSANVNFLIGSPPSGKSVVSGRSSPALL